MDRRNFVKNCSFGLCASVFLNNLILEAKAIYDNIPDNRLDAVKGIFCLEIHLAEHCNLNCKYCCHFSSIAKPEFYDVKKFEKDIEILAHSMNGIRILYLNLMGGEPLLHPQVDKLMAITRKYFPDTKINLVTNAILLDSMKPKFWKTAHRNNIAICPTIYPININWDSVLAKAKKYNADIMTIIRDKRITKKETENKVKYFDKYVLDLDGKQSTNRAECRYGKILSYKDGKIYRCYVSAYIRHFNNKFNKNLEHTKNDYIDLYSKNYTKKDLGEIFRSWDESYSFCKYCKAILPNYKWENSTEHDISEWT